MTTEYDKDGVSKRAYGYSRGGRMVAMVGEKSFGLEVSDHQTEYWDALFTSIPYLDDILDGEASQNERLEEFQRALDVITTGVPDLALNEDGQHLLFGVREAGLKLEPSTLAEFAKQAHTIALLGERARTTTNTHSLGVIALAEGRVTGRMISVGKNATATDPAKFNDYLQQGGAYANLLDSLIDLNKDYSEGLLAFQATRTDRIELLKMFLPGGLDSVRKLKPALALYFAAKAAQAIVTKHPKI